MCVLSSKSSCGHVHFSYGVMMVQPNDDDQLLPMPTTTTTSFLPAAANELK